MRPYWNEKIKFSKIASDIKISRSISLKLVQCLVFTEWACWVNKQYLRREYLEISNVSGILRISGIS